MISIIFDDIVMGNYIYHHKSAYNACRVLNNYHDFITGMQYVQRALNLLFLVFQETRHNTRIWRIW